ncbi:hypothetical protein HGRIS_002157 [Hohenbuehelia grisea]|uniref:RRM domain-containing protein n=1 Tax=Hohenbuehelia grisea TaxID=104357 RepID=A0ABR3JKR7_9AGAR
MASLLERMSIPSPAGGPIRSSRSGQSSRSSTPYNRSNRSKGDIDAQWSHDLFDSNASNAGSLSARLAGTPSAPRANFKAPAIQKAFRDVGVASNELSIKGAAAGNVVEVTGLADGTTPADVSAIFKTCGAITSAAAVPNKKEVTIRVTFKQASSANAAIAKFDKQPADGKTLSVKVVGTAATSLGGRLGGTDGLGLVRQEGSVDVLMENSDGQSKMRSDALVSADPRAQVLVAPPGANPADYTQGTNRGRRGRGRGANRGGRRRGGNGAGKMQVD